jgi:hypothetical protein
MVVAILITFYRLQPLIGFGNYSSNRALGNGHWAMGIGQWALGNGHWEIGIGQWAMGNGQWE